MYGLEPPQRSHSRPPEWCCRGERFLHVPKPASGPPAGPDTSAASASSPAPVPSPLAPANSAAAGHWLHLSRTAMACRFELTLPSELAHHLDAAQAALDTIDVARGSAEHLPRLQRAVGHQPRRRRWRRWPAKAAVRSADACAGSLHRETAGAFDITSTPLSRVWGFLRREGRLPSPRSSPRPGPTWARSTCASIAQTRTVRLRRARSGAEPRQHRQGLRPRPGAAGLYADGRAHRAAQRRRQQPAGCRRRARRPRFRGRHPRPVRSRRRYGTVRLANNALGVSGIGEQSFEVDGRRYGHIIDPRSGWPVEGRALVAVVAPTAALADALATAFFVGGPECRRAIHSTHPDVSVVVIDMPLQDKVSPPVFFGRRADWRLPRAA